MRLFSGMFAFRISLTLILLSPFRIECTPAVALASPPQAGAQMLDTETGTCYAGAPQKVRVEHHGKIDTVICEDGAVFQCDHGRQQVIFVCMSKRMRKK